MLVAHLRWMDSMKTTLNTESRELKKRWGHCKQAAQGITSHNFNTLRRYWSNLLRGRSSIWPQSMKVTLAWAGGSKWTELTTTLYHTPSDGESPTQRTPSIQHETSITCVSKV